MTRHGAVCERCLVDTNSILQVWASFVTPTCWSSNTPIYSLTISTFLIGTFPGRPVGNISSYFVPSAKRELPFDLNF